MFHPSICCREQLISLQAKDSSFVFISSAYLCFVLHFRMIVIGRKTLVKTLPKDVNPSKTQTFILVLQDN